MRKQLLTAAAVLLSFCGYAQTKGTNALSLGVSVSSNKNQANVPTGSSTEDVKNNYFNLGYGHFISENSKLGIDLLYMKNTSKSSNAAQNNKTNGYGVNLSYQKYYPLIGKFYAYAGGSGIYTFTKLTYDDPANRNKVESKDYGLSAYGGITWFIHKRWALETKLLSATAYYSDIDQTNDTESGSIYRNKRTNFDLSTEGFIKDLGFKIYLMF